MVFAALIVQGCNISTSIHSVRFELLIPCMSTATQFQSKVCMDPMCYIQLYAGENGTSKTISAHHIKDSQTHHFSSPFSYSDDLKWNNQTISSDSLENDERKEARNPIKAEQQKRNKSKKQPRTYVRLSWLEKRNLLQIKFRQRLFRWSELKICCTSTASESLAHTASATQ